MASDKLQAALQGKVFFGDAEEYNSSVQSYYYCSARQKPLCVVIPSSATDVSTVINILAENAGATFAIRSGGHSPHPDMANTDTGVTIDLRELNSITKSAKKEDVYELGVGATWDSVYKVLGKENRTCLGSRVHNVGVGGFLIGGGISYFAPQLGFACDHILNMEVVLASGDIIEVNESSHGDLFWALKGGGSNFGVVTRIDITTIPHQSLWGGATTYPYDTRDANLKAFSEFKTTDRYDPFAQMELSFLFSARMGGHYISNNHWYLRPIENPETFQRFENIQPQMLSTMRLDTIQALATEASQYQPQNKFAMFSTTSFEMSPTIMPKITSLWEDSSKSLNTVKDLLSVLTYQQCPPPPKNSTNAMGFPSDSKPHEKLIILAVTLYWESGEDSSPVTEETKLLINRIEEVTKKEGVYHPFKYVNYAAPWQEPFESYGEKPYMAMKKVSEKYDPEGLFQTKCLGFKL